MVKFKENKTEIIIKEYTRRNGEKYYMLHCKITKWYFWGIFDISTFYGLNAITYKDYGNAFDDYLKYKKEMEDRYNLETVSSVEIDKDLINGEIRLSSTWVNI